MLEGRLVGCFKACVETESREYYMMWDRLLKALEEATERKAEDRDGCDPAVTNMLNSLTAALKSDQVGEDWAADMADLTKRLRLAISKVSNRQVAIAIETVWAAGMYLTRRYVASAHKETSTDCEGSTPTVPKLHASAQSSPMTLQRKLVTPIQNALNETVKQLQATNERLLQDADHYMSLIRDRDAELKEYRNFSSLRDLDRFSEELTAYLSDAEGRQIANVEVLESISQLLNHKWTASPERRSKTRKTSQRPSRLSSPDRLQRSRQTPIEDVLGPGKKPKGSTAFFASSQSNASSRTGSPHMSRAGSPIPERPPKDVEAVSIQEITSPRLPQVDSKTGRGFTTVCIEIRPAFREEVRSDDSKAAVASAEPTSEAPKEVLTLDIRQPIVEESKEQIPEVEMEATEESQAGDSDSPQYEDKAVQTELKLAELIGQRDEEPRVPGPPRRKKPNLLLMQLEKLEKRQPPMPEKVVFRLFESAMDEKVHSDSIETEAGRSPKTMTEFMLDFLYTQYGLKTLTLKNLSGLINALEVLAGHGNPYGVLFCRLLEVFTEEPIDDALAFFLTKARAAFCSLQSKAKQSQLSKLGLEVGGKVALAEVADLVFVLFLADRDAGESVLERLLPPDLNLVERATLLFCGKLAKTGRELKLFYIQIDTEKTGSVKYPAFEKGIRETCEMPVSKAQVQALWQFLDTDSLSFAQLTKLNFKDYAQKAFSKELSVSKCDFMLEIAREYEKKRTVEREELTKMFRLHESQGEGVMNLEEFTRLITGLNPEITKTKAVSIFREALDYSDNPQNLDALDPSAFCYIALKYRLGSAGKSVFDSDLKQLSDRLRDQFIHYEHEQGNMAVATNRFSRRYSKAKPPGL